MWKTDNFQLDKTCKAIQGSDYLLSIHQTCVPSPTYTESHDAVNILVSQKPQQVFLNILYLISLLGIHSCFWSLVNIHQGVEFDLLIFLFFPKENKMRDKIQMINSPNKFLWKQITVAATFKVRLRFRNVKCIQILICRIHFDSFKVLLKGCFRTLN